MIEIEDIHSASFPTVDFKFVNRGTAAAVLWQVGVDIQAISVDRTPILDFFQTVQRGELEVLASNRGWGPAQILDLRLTSTDIPEIIQQIVSVDVPPAKDNTTIGRVSVETKQFGSTDKLNLLIDSRNKLIASLPERMRAKDTTLTESADLRLILSVHERWHLEEYFDNLARGDKPTGPRQKWHIEYLSKISRNVIPVRPLTMECTVRGSDGSQHAISEELESGYGQTWLSWRGFTFQELHPPMASAMPPTVRVVCMLNVDKGNFERKYRISTKTPPGDAERFQITIGSDKSCFAEAVFKFYFDGGQTVHSNRFNLNVYRPYKSYVAHKDGEQFVPTDHGWRLADSSGHITREEEW